MPAVYFATLFMLSPITGFANPKSASLFPGYVVKNGQLATDLNGDKHADIVDLFNSKGLLVERRQDKNFDKKFDVFTIFPVKSTDKMEVKTDSDFNGSIDTIEKRYFENDFIVVERNLLDLTTKKFRRVGRKHFRTAKVLTNQKECLLQPSPLKQKADIENLAKLLSGMGLSPFVGDFATTHYGVKIEKSCRPYELVLTHLFGDSLRKTFACLNDLKSPDATANLHRLASVFLNEKNPMKLTCKPAGTEWGSNTLGSATAPGDKDYPLIRVNIKMFQNMKREYNPAAELSDTLIHEPFHTVGYLHGLDIEFPETCTRCCGSEVDKDVKDLGCKICRGGYQSKNDPRYVHDIVAFNNISGRPDDNIEVLFNYLKDRPKDRWANFQLISVGINSEMTPLAIAYAENFQKEFQPLSKHEQEFVDMITKSNGKSEAFYVDGSRALVAAHRALLAGDLTAMENALKNAKFSEYNPAKMTKYDNQVVSTRYALLDARTLLLDLLCEEYDRRGNPNGADAAWAKLK